MIVPRLFSSPLHTDVEPSRGPTHGPVTSEYRGSFPWSKAYHSPTTIAVVKNTSSWLCVQLDTCGDFVFMHSILYESRYNHLNDVGSIMHVTHIIPNTSEVRRTSIFPKVRKIVSALNTATLFENGEDTLLSKTK